MKQIQFWFSIGSTYTYLSVTRIGAVAKETGTSFSWQPFSVRKIMREMDNVPFPPSKKTKVDYMWRDIERRAQAMDFRRGFPLLIRWQSSTWPIGLPCWACRKAGVRTMSVQPIEDGFSMGRKRVESPICQTPCQRSARISPACLTLRTVPTLKPLILSRPSGRRHSGFSVARRSSLTASFSGEMIVWKTLFAGHKNLTESCRYHLSP